MNVELMKHICSKIKKNIHFLKNSLPNRIFYASPSIRKNLRRKNICHKCQHVPNQQIGQSEITRDAIPSVGTMHQHSSMGWESAGYQNLRKVTLAGNLSILFSYAQPSNRIAKIAMLWALNYQWQLTNLQILFWKS